MIFRFKRPSMLREAVFGRYLDKGLTGNDSSTLVTYPSNSFCKRRKRHAHPRLHLLDYLKMVAFIAINSKERYLLLKMSKILSQVLKYFELLKALSKRMLLSRLFSLIFIILMYNIIIFGLLIRYFKNQKIHN